MTEPSEEIHLRPARDEDFEFLFSVRRATMKAYVEQAWGRWDDTEQADRIRGRLDPAAVRIILSHQQEIGYLAVDDLGDSLFIGFIGILPEHQRRALGTLLLRQVIGEADRRQIPTRLNVLKVNPARALYERFGFVIVDSEGVRYHMERPPRHNSQSKSM